MLVRQKRPCIVMARLRAIAHSRKDDKLPVLLCTVVWALAAMALPTPMGLHASQHVLCEMIGREGEEPAGGDDVDT